MNDIALLAKNLIEPFATWLEEIAEDSAPLATSGDFNHQGRTNMVSFATGSEEGPHAASDFERFLRAVATLRQLQLRPEHPDVPFLFYAWYDEQAPYVACSVIQSDDPTDLPFGSTVDPTTELTTIVSKVAVGWDSTNWKNFEEVRPGESEDDGNLEYVLQVFTLLL